MESLRYNPPTKLNEAEFGTVYRVLNEDDTETFWIQTNEDIGQPKWVKLSDMLEKVLACKIVEHKWLLKGFLDLYKNPQLEFSFALTKEKITIKN